MVLESQSPWGVEQGQHMAGAASWVVTSEPQAGSRENRVEMVGIFTSQSLLSVTCFLQQGCISQDSPNSTPAGVKSRRLWSAFSFRPPHMVNWGSGRCHRQLFGCQSPFWIWPWSLFLYPQNRSEEEKNQTWDTLCSCLSASMTGFKPRNHALPFHNVQLTPKHCSMGSARVAWSWLLGWLHSPQNYSSYFREQQQEGPEVGVTARQGTCLLLEVTVCGGRAAWFWGVS